MRTRRSVTTSWRCSSTPATPIAQNNLGALLHRRGDVQAAIDHYQLALRSDAKHRKAHLNLGSALEDQGRLEDAIGHYQRALELAPEDPVARHALEQALAARDAAASSPH